MSDLRSRLANAAWRAVCEPARQRLAAALHHPEAAQRAVLQRILVSARNTEFSRRHGLHPDMSANDYRQAVPVRSYEDHVRDIERMKAGAADVLCAGLPLAFERSSGSTAAAKYLPFTAGLRAEFQEAIRAWMGDLFSRHPSVMGGPAWWLVSPLRREPPTTGGIPVGLPGDDEYLGPLERRLASWLWAVPPAVASVESLEASMDWSLRFLIQSPGLRLISVWNASFLTILWRRLLERPGAFIDGLARGTWTDAHPLLDRGLRAMPERAAALRKRLQVPGDVWPHLALVSAWADAGAGRDAVEVQDLFPGTGFQAKGLLSTEGAVTVPWGDDAAAGIPALHSHYLEFQERPEGDAGGIHTLQPGREYAVILTTSGGLYRYRTGDLVQVECSCGETPRLRFTGRADDVVDLRGEKLNPRFVREALAGIAVGFHLLAPSMAVEPPHYVLFTAAPGPAAEKVDAVLRANPHYAHARDAGQLGMVRVVWIDPVTAPLKFLSHCAAAAQRPGPVKSTVLHRSSDWERVFSEA